MSVKEERWSRGNRTVNRGDGGPIPPTAVSKLRQFRSPHICLCLSEETLKVGGPFYLVSMPEEVKDPTQGVNALPVVDSLILEKDNSEHQARQCSSHKHVANIER